MGNVTKKTKKMRIRKGRVLLLILFIVWTIFSGMFLSKVIGPSINLWILKDNYQFSQEFGNPYDRTEVDESFIEYKSFTNSLINSEDATISFYAQQDGIVKVALVSISVVPFIIIVAFVVSAHNEEKARKKANQLKCRTAKSFKKPASVN